MIDGAPVPIVSRGLAGGRAAAEGDLVVAADEDGDRVLLVEPDRQREVLLPAGSAPGDVALEGSRAAIAFQGPGALLLLDTDRLEVEDQVAVCAEPRGVDLAGGTAWVACGDGMLAGVEPGRPAVVHPVAADLTHVLVEVGETTALVASDRGTEVLRIDLGSGALVDRFPLPSLPSPDGRTLVGRVVRRLADGGDGRTFVLHQAHVADPIPLTIAGEPAYGTGACLAVARPLLSWIGADGFDGTVRVDAVLPLDVVAWRDGDGAFPVPTPIVGASDAGAGPGVQSVYPPEGLSDPAQFCVPRTLLGSTAGPVVGLAMGPDGPVAVTRAPFTVSTAAGELVAADPGELPDAGLLLFHASSPSGVACATCHPGGRDDAHTWEFEGMGPRRTQALAGGLVATAPFHWDGTLPDMAALFDETGVARMGHAPRPETEVAALEAWLDRIPLAAVPSTDPAAVAAGEAVFAWAGCPDCHPAPAYTDNRTLDVGTGGAFQVPSLRGVSRRLPLMHDGCAATLDDRFDPMCGGDAHGPADTLSVDELADLVSFLTSL